MLTAPLPEDEAVRLLALKSLGLLDSPDEERFDRLTRLARRLFDVPIALVSLVDKDRQWFKSCYGLDAREAGRDISFCGHAIMKDRLLEIPDTHLDERFRDNPLVTEPPNIRYYAGRPLRAPNGELVGTLCIIDKRPRQLNAEDLSLLDDLGAMAEGEFKTVQLATVDDLTGLSNRRGFRTLGASALSMCARYERPASLIMFDVDRFKSVNDLHGHAVGDRVLTTLARVLKDVFRESDLIARLGGDEFVVLASGSGPADISSMLDRFAKELRQAGRKIIDDVAISCSSGCAAFDPEHPVDLDSLLKRADEAMYCSRAADRRRSLSERVVDS